MFLSDVADFAITSSSPTSKKKKPYNPYHPWGLVKDVALGSALSGFVLKPAVAYGIAPSFVKRERDLLNAGNHRAILHHRRSLMGLGAAITAGSILGTHIARRSLENPNRNRK